MSEPVSRSVFAPDDDESARVDAEAMAAYREGRCVPHAEVAMWLDSWGTPNERPRPEPKQR